MNAFLVSFFVPLPSHLMWLITLSQGEGAGEVAGEEVHLLDVGEEGLVDCLLIVGAGAADLLLLYQGIEGQLSCSLSVLQCIEICLVSEPKRDGAKVSLQTKLLRPYLISSSVGAMESLNT